MSEKIDYYLLETVTSAEHARVIINIIRKIDYTKPIMVSLYINKDNQENISSLFELPIERLMVNCCSFSDLTSFYSQYLKDNSWKKIKFGFYCNKIHERAYSVNCQVSNLQKFKHQEQISEDNLRVFLESLPFNEILIGGCCGYGVEEMSQLSSTIRTIQGL